MSGSTATPILGIQQVAANQNQKEITINDGFLALENATNATLAVSLATGNAATLSAAQFASAISFTCSGQTSGAVLTVPLVPRLFLVNNTGTFAVAVPGGHSRRHDFQAASLVIDSLADSRLYEALGIAPPR